MTRPRRNGFDLVMEIMEWRASHARAIHCPERARRRERAARLAHYWAERVRLYEDGLECPCCGDVGAVPDSSGYFIDGQDTICDRIAITPAMLESIEGGEPLACGCKGRVVFDDEDGRVWMETEQ